MKRIRYFLEVEEDKEGNIFYYVEFGNGKKHEREKLWIDEELVWFGKEKKPYVDFPIENAMIDKFQKGFIAVPEKGYKVFIVISGKLL